ncbi:MAG: hypothetical protein LBV38_07545 [Alistipes sp.]|jgi:hypothetical protein|nr:hypothetical protein [Alistipes sp.]
MKAKLLLAILSLALVACGGTDKNLFTASGDVGAVKIPGSVAYDSAAGRYTLTGAGTNMWLTEDEFFMTWREVTGDFSLSANVEFEGTGLNAHRKLGLIVRSSTAPGAVYADAAVHGDGLYSLQYRPTDDADTLEAVAQPTGSSIPQRITLERRGDRISISATGTSPAQSASEATLSLPATCMVGLFVCSHEADHAETAHFTDIVFTQL